MCIRYTNDDKYKTPYYSFHRIQAIPNWKRADDIEHQLMHYLMSIDFRTVAAGFNILWNDSESRLEAPEL